MVDAHAGKHLGNGGGASWVAGGAFTGFNHLGFAHRDEKGRAVGLGMAAQVNYMKNANEIACVRI